MATERTVMLMRITADQIPAQNSAAKLALPDLVNNMINAEDWTVVDHAIAAPDLSGDFLLSVYCER